MRLTRDQIERMYFASQENGATEFEVQYVADGKQLRFYAVEMVEQRTPLALGKAVKA